MPGIPIPEDTTQSSSTLAGAIRASSVPDPTPLTATWNLSTFAGLMGMVVDGTTIYLRFEDRGLNPLLSPEVERPQADLIVAGDLLAVLDAHPTYDVQVSDGSSFGWSDGFTVTATPTVGVDPLAEGTGNIPMESVLPTIIPF